MEDIEDMFKNDDDDTTQQRVVKSKVMRKAKAPGKHLSKQISPVTGVSGAGHDKFIKIRLLSEPAGRLRAHKTKKNTT
jgi:hypothetical protein